MNGLQSDPDALLRPARLYGWRDLADAPQWPPARAGVYAWFFDVTPPGVPTSGCVTYEGHTLLYLGISPKAPPKNGRPPSSATLRSRVRYHYQGNAEGSTLRLTLGCLLAENLDISLRRVGSGNRMTFTLPGEAKLTEWMRAHARVCWVEHPNPWDLEHELIQRVCLPLNLDQNSGHPFWKTLSGLRAAAKTTARTLPVVAH
jgi:hypothetical protein